MKKDIKDLRVKIDGLAQLSNNLNPTIKVERTDLYKCGNCREVRHRGYMCMCSGGGYPTSYFENVPTQSKPIDKSIDSLYLAKAWLGKVLEELGGETPYKNDGKRKSIEDIEPVADHLIIAKARKSKRVINFERRPHIGRVDWLREEINDIVKELNDLYDSVVLSCKTFEYEPNRDLPFLYEATKHLIEARFWLGFELQRIREENGANNKV